MGRRSNILLEIAAKVAELFFLNLLFVICCIPVVTIGMAVSALYSVFFKQLDGKDKGVLRDFFGEMKASWKRCLIINLFLLVIGAMLGGATWMYFRSGYFSHLTMRVLFIIFWGLYLSVYSWVYPLTAKFEAPTGATLLNAFFMTFRHWPVTLLLVMVNVSLPAFFLVVSETWINIYLFIVIFFGCSLPVFSASRLLHDCLQQYIPKEESEES